MRQLRALGAFAYDFVVGDDWRMALGVVVTLALVALGAHHGFAAWWLAPLGVAVTLGTSLLRAARAHSRATDAAD